MPGAFDETLESGADVVALFNHDKNAILGRRSSNTLQLEVDRKGLRYSTSEASTAVYRDVQAWQERGELRGSSFGFRVTKQKYVRDGDKQVREIYGVVLLDVGPVTFPAYVATENGNVLRRCVTPEGRCEVLPADVAGECRSAIAAGIEQLERERLRQAVEVRARAVQVDSRHVGL